MHVPFCIHQKRNIEKKTVLLVRSAAVSQSCNHVGALTSQQLGTGEENGRRVICLGRQGRRTLGTATSSLPPLRATPSSPQVAATEQSMRDTGGGEASPRA